MAKRTKQYYYGCTPSKLDGSEHTVNIDEKIAIPEEFSWQNVMPPVRNQGETSTCVCQSLTGMLDFLYNNITGISGKCNNFSIQELYDSRARKDVEGMSIKEALHYLRHKGLNDVKINEYAIVGSSELLKRCILMFGPCAGGLPVYSITDKVHFWRKRGRMIGGHCITFVGYNAEGFIIRNSWGTQWGNNGHTVIPYDEWEKNCFETWTILL